MPAPKGNKFAKGHGCGRPLKYDLSKEAKELDEWSKHENALSLYEFTDKKEYLAQQLTLFAQRSEDFDLALKKAKERISLRREKKVHEGTFNYGIYQRSIRLYDNLLAQQEDHDADRDAERKRKIAEVTTNPIQSQLLEALARNNAATKELVS